MAKQPMHRMPNGTMMSNEEHRRMMGTPVPKPKRKRKKGSKK